MVYFMYCDLVNIRTSRTNSPKLPHRPKPDVNTLGSLSWRSAGGTGRDVSTLMEIHLNKVFDIWYTLAGVQKICPQSFCVLCFQCVYTGLLCLSLKLKSKALV